MINPEYVAEALLEAEDNEPVVYKAESRTVEEHDYVLISRLPPLSRLLEEADHAAKDSGEHAVIGISMEEAIEDILEPPEESDPELDLTRWRSASESSASKGGSGAGIKLPSFSKSTVKAASPRKRPYQSHDVYRAIEKKDLTTLFDIRDHAFHLLVQKSAGIGKSHSDISVLITGALSRFVNQLPDDVSEVDPKMSSLIRAVRANLKLAINASLSANQTDLISSYLQIIIMSEGEKWIRDQTQNVALAIKAGKSARPVYTARTAVTNFATKELRQLERVKGNALASVEDYVANACCDLVLMALWAIVSDKLGGDLLPTYQFSRDERIFRSFTNAIDGVSKKMDYTLKITKSVRVMIEQATEIMDKRATGHPEKARLLADAFDAPS